MAPLLAELGAEEGARDLEVDVLVENAAEDAVGRRCFGRPFARTRARRAIPNALVAVLLGALGFGGPACSGGEAPRLRVVLVTLDTLRSDAFAEGEAGASELPQLAAYARGGAVFTRAYSASNATQPTHASLFTGLHPWEHGLTRNGMVLGDELSTVAERLREAGFATGAVVASFPLARRFGFAQGFDVYREVFSRELVPGLRRWEKAEVPAGAFYSLAAAVNDEAQSLLRELGGGRQFVWVHYFDAHDPYGDAGGDGGEVVSHPDLLEARREGQAPLLGLLGRARELYRRDLASLDAELARFLAALDRDAARIETHVVVTADHGESFGEGRHVGHGESLGPQEMHVPLFIVSPRVGPGPRAEVAASIDVAATLLSLAGLPGGPGRDLTLAPGAEPWVAWGMASSTANESPGGAPRARFFAAHASGLWAGDETVVGAADGSAGAPPKALASALRLRFAAFEESARGAKASELADEPTREALRALGYAE